MIEKIFKVAKIKNVGSKEEPRFKRVLTKKTKSLNYVEYIKHHFYHLISDEEDSKQENLPKRPLK
jgi:hypothetical protein